MKTFNFKKLSLNKQIQITDFTNLMFFATAIGLFFLLLTPTETLDFSKVVYIESIFIFELFLACIHVIFIYTFANINKNSI